MPLLSLQTSETVFVRSRKSAKPFGQLSVQAGSGDGWRGGLFVKPQTRQIVGPGDRLGCGSSLNQFRTHAPPTVKDGSVMARRRLQYAPCPLNTVGIVRIRIQRSHHSDMRVTYRMSSVTRWS